MEQKFSFKYRSQTFSKKTTFLILITSLPTFKGLTVVYNLFNHNMSDKTQNLLIYKVWQGVVNIAAFRSLVIFNWKIGTKAIRLSPKLINLNDVVLDINSKLFAILNKNYVYHELQIYVRTFSIRGGNPDSVYSFVLWLRCSNTHFHTYFHLDWLIMQMPSLIHK